MGLGNLGMGLGNLGMGLGNLGMGLGNLGIAEPIVGMRIESQVGEGLEMRLGWKPGDRIGEA